MRGLRPVIRPRGGAVRQSRADLLRGVPMGRGVPVDEVARLARRAGRVLVVLDDDPTGSQSVAGLPVLLDWTAESLRWALGQGVPAVYVLTNSRSLTAEDARRRTEEVARAALDAARLAGVRVDFVSRSDSTLRGHFPLETDTLARVVRAATGGPPDGVVLVPAFPDAGRITVGSVHYAGTASEGYLPVGETEFAADATFGYASSDLRDWVAEKSAGRYPARDVARIDLPTLRTEPDATVRVLRGLADARPAFVRAVIGQRAPVPLTAADVARVRAGGPAADAPGGLVVVGSHVSVTTGQLDRLVERSQPTLLELDVPALLAGSAEQQLHDLAHVAIEALATGTVALGTSRTLERAADAEGSLAIARRVSAAVCEVVRRVLAARAPRFVVAKGGITASDVATRGLSIGRAMVRGPMLPGIVSLWEPLDGPARGIPYVVFAGNVGGPDSLADVVDTLSARP
jgi:uncharacterized protein YgbK (DUF1537 family)